MPNQNTLSRSSIDLGHGRNRNPNELSNVSVQLPRPQPPRLQHSPSLPNIWFPPHSGPIPHKCLVTNNDPPRRPLTPPALVPSDNPTQTSIHPENLSGVNKTVETGAGTPIPAASPGDSPASIAGDTAQMRKEYRRSQPDCAEPHPLLTPPLTPSSSIRTTASQETSSSAKQFEGASDTCTTELTEELDPACSRFLLLGNISKEVDPDDLQTAIAESLLLTRPDDAHEQLVVPSRRNTQPPNIRDIIKGLYLRSHHTHGFVILAFYDIRQAPIAKLKLQDPSYSALAKCVAEGVQWLSCRFVSSDELIEMRSTPPFLASMDSSFFIRVYRRGVDDRSTSVKIVDENQVDPVTSSPANNTGSKSSEVRVSMLQRLLESFGCVRSFIPEGSQKDEKGDFEVFRVEYYDTREADSAYVALEGQALFGMHLAVYGRDVGRAASQRGTGDRNSRNTVSKPETPSVAVASSEVTTPGIGRPGQHSQIRERLGVADQPTKTRTFNNAQSMRTTISLVAPALPEPSPTYFYNSATPAPDGNHVHGKNSHTPIQDAKSYSNGQTTPRVETQIRGHAEAPPHWAQVPVHAGDVVPYPYGLDYYYYASRPPIFSPSLEMAYYSGCSSPPLPAVYYQQPQSPQAAQHAGNQAGGIYDYECRLYAGGGVMTPPLNSWLPDQNTALSHPMRSGNVPMGEYWIPELHGYPSLPMFGLPPYHQFPPMCPTPVDHVASTELSVQATNETSWTTHDRSRGGPEAPTVPTVTTGSTRDTSLHERNQLNIARIEDGQDTRTTVMIKNIPNKMSDKDLITFINKVTPRRIDFLYLRMDFQNGCNVGYAFVNFIHVQDLLAFAKSKLGEKWNMFSSEKVLQMSYANYQGKEALVEKFKNSCIMDEREAWRPKIFYSEPGPDQGLPQPFPAPTHLRRKERSSHNRGALYVPGVGGTTASHGLLTHRRAPHADSQQSDRHGRAAARYKEGGIASVNKNSSTLFHGP